MARIKVGICMEDLEYVKRLSSFLMNHYKGRMEIFTFQTPADIEEKKEANPDVVLVSEEMSHWDELKAMFRDRRIPVITLTEESKAVEQDYETVSKYQDVNRIVDEILKHVGSEVEQVMTAGRIASRVELIGVYSLTESEFQLPFAVTMGAVFGEKRHVLLLDLQENSGLSQLYEGEQENGLEELMVMASLGRYTTNRIRNCIGHLDHLDCVYPARRSENLCDIEKGIYPRLIQLLLQNHNYSVLILNFGSRFPGFFELMEQCQSIFLLKGQHTAYWREKEWEKEMENLGYQSLSDRIIPVSIPGITSEIASCEKLVEQWRWNEVGSTIRKNRKEA